MYAPLVSRTVNSISCKIELNCWKKSKYVYAFCDANINLIIESFLVLQAFAVPPINFTQAQDGHV